MDELMCGVHVFGEQPAHFPTTDARLSDYPEQGTVGLNGQPDDGAGLLRRERCFSGESTPGQHQPFEWIMRDIAPGTCRLPDYPHRGEYVSYCLRRYFRCPLRHRALNGLDVNIRDWNIAEGGYEPFRNVGAFGRLPAGLVVDKNVLLPPFHKLCEGDYVACGAQPGIYRREDLV